ncbi:MAG TPA: protein translocase SEC61 complex subunit gamma [Methanothermococcus okinawensis]|uniref:Protein translocase subunit SecE n=1 Tax=Methanothermococcus okinawensis TaxID=155863 RepID=A0A832YRG7_9EURY|nr:protein translocase SEC61 complex subunit gamma [Methanothermococcus okinawensis]
MAEPKKNDNDKRDKKIDRLESVKAFLNQCRRVLMILRRPTKEEFLNMSKVTGLGICFLGLLGYIIHVPITYLKGLIKP